MKIINITKKSTVLIFAYLCLLFVGSLCAQTSYLTFSWDKLGCQQDTLKKVNFDDNFDLLPCLKVCKGSTNIYRISGTDTENVDYVRWYVTGGHKEDENNLFAMPVTWDNTSTGTLRIVVVLLNGDMLDKTICVDKSDSSLIFGWDRIGCQMNKDNVSEIKLDENLSTAGCLRVCKNNTINYRVFGSNADDIETIHWTLTGGPTDALEGMRILTIPISWDNSAAGAIEMHIVFNDGTNLDKTICVEKIQSTLLLDWEKIEESAVSQIKFDNSVDNADLLLAYPESTVLYKLDGANLVNVQSVNWNVSGGYVYNPNKSTAIITWEEANVHIIQINVTYADGRTTTRNINVVNMERPTPGNNELNAVKFEYDTAGNQKKRSFIYLSSRHKNPDTSDEDSKSLIKSDLYDDISYYPNPVRLELYVTWKNENKKEVVKLELYNLNGMMLKTFDNLHNAQDITIGFEHIPTGVYDLRLIYTDGEKKSLKVIKQ